MSDSPGDLRYTRDHEWLRIEQDGTAVIGITDHAQSALGDLVYVELPELDAELDAGEGLAVVESVKAASDVYAPVSGKVVGANESLADTPEAINSDPYGEGWIAILALSDRTAVDALMSAEDYDQFVIESESD